jgi:hypothetical protein
MLSTVHAGDELSCDLLAGHLETLTLRGGELKGNPTDWQRVCQMSRPHGLEGGRTKQRAERNAENFGLDEEMLRAAK